MNRLVLTSVLNMVMVFLLGIMYIKILPKTFCRGRKGQANWHFVDDSEWMGVLKVKCAGGGGAPRLH
jgi:hypothetical protein